MTAAKKIGRPRGKRSDPNMESTTLILRKQTKSKVRWHLYDSALDMSDLVNLLLSQWLQQQEAMKAPDKSRIVSLFPEPE